MSMITSRIMIYYFGVFFFVGCALPVQPQLTEREKEYFKYLEEDCKCRVRRSIDSSVLKNQQSDRTGGYMIIFEDVPISTLLNNDSLKSVSNLVANHLYNHVLIGDSVFPFTTITVEFSSQIGENTYKSRYYDFDIKELKGN